MHRAFYQINKRDYLRRKCCKSYSCLLGVFEPFRLVRVWITSSRIHFKTLRIIGCFKCFFIQDEPNLRGLYPKSIDDSNWFIGMQQKENSIKEGSCPLFCVFITTPEESSMTHNKLKMKIWVHCSGDFVIRVCVLSCDSWEGDIDVGVKFQMKMTKNQSFIVYSILNVQQAMRLRSG